MSFVSKSTGERERAFVCVGGIISNLSRGKKVHHDKLNAQWLIYYVFFSRSLVTRDVAQLLNTIYTFLWYTIYAHVCSYIFNGVRLSVNKIDVSPIRHLYYVTQFTIYVYEVECHRKWILTWIRCSIHNVDYPQY